MTLVIVQSRIRSFSLLAKLLAAVVLIVFGLSRTADIFAQESSPAGFVSSQSNIEQLISQLDASEFAAREQATESLIELGSEAIEPLVEHFFGSSSEAGWRIHRVLEGIGKHGNERDFLRSFAIIQLLFGSQDTISQDRLAELQFEWKVTQRREAARSLGESGIVFAANEMNPADPAVMERARIAMMVRAAELGGPAGGVISLDATPLNPVSANPTAAKKWKDPRQNREESLAQIEQIIGSSVEENRRKVYELLPEDQQVSLPPGTLELPEGWVANEKSMEVVRQLGPIANLKLNRQKVGDSMLDFIRSQQSLSSVEFIDCSFDSNLSFPDSVITVSFQKSMPSPEQLDAAPLSQNSKVTTLRLGELKLDEEMATLISQSRVQLIELVDVSFTRKGINQLLSMKSLFRLTTSLCKFELEWIEEARRTKQNLVFAAPRAFLGVQGPIDRVGVEGGSGCQISEVVAGTGAANAGMQPADVVLSADGNAISRFEDLRLMISQKRPGEQMKMKIQRGDEEIELDVTLGDMTIDR